MQSIYTTTATASGDGRNGHTASEDGQIDLDVRIPAEMGGPGGATNPEQLFAAGYAACFNSALRLTATSQGVEIGESAVSATVGIGMNGAGGFGLSVELDVDLPGVDAAVAQGLVEAAHQVCPYSNATRGNIDVALRVVGA
ncbi:MAG: organic hydroperoxide resistance protein [Acidimicrobiales bacterium]